MEDKLRKLLKDIGEKDINFKSEFAREQVLSDILRIIKDNMVILTFKNSNNLLENIFLKIEEENRD